MSNRRNRRGASTPARPKTATAAGPARWLLVAFVLPLLLVAGALLAYRATVGSSDAASTANAAPHTKGPADAAITITEWGDFQ